MVVIYYFVWLKKKNAHGGAHVGQGMDVFITCRPGMFLPIVDVHVYQCGLANMDYNIIKGVDLLWFFSSSCRLTHLSTLSIHVHMLCFAFGSACSFQFQ